MKCIRINIKSLSIITFVNCGIVERRTKVKYKGLSIVSVLNCFERFENKNSTEFCEINCEKLGVNSIKESNAVALNMLNVSFKK